MTYTPPYNTEAEIRRRSGITGNVNISTASITTKLTIADGIVEGYCSQVYQIPFSHTCSLIKELSGEIAEALILKEEYSPEVADTDKDGFRKYDNAIAILSDIQARKLKLYSDPGVISGRVELTRRTSDLPTSFPDATSDGLTTSASTAPVVRMGDTY